MTISKKNLSRWLRIAGLAAALLLVVTGVVGAFWVYRTVQGKGFADHAAELVERATGCTGRFDPFSFAGFGLATAGYQGKGNSASHFASIAAKNVRIELDPLAILRFSLQVRRVSIRKLVAVLQRPSVENKAGTAGTSAAGEEKGLARWSLGRFRIASLGIGWPETMAGGGSAEGIDLRGEGSEEGWGLRAKGGSIRVAGLPELRLAEAHGLLEGKTLRMEAAELHPKDAPEALVAGTGKLGLAPSEPTDLSWQIQALPTWTVLPSPWKERVSGEVRGFGKVLAEEGGPYEWKGDLFLDQGVLHDIPFLVALDSLLRVRALQDVSLSRAQCHVEGKGERMRISDIAIQSGETMVIHGWAEVEGKRVSGVLNVGLRSELAQLIPRVNLGLFELGAGGYFWTTVRLSGTTDHVQEDLTPRLDWAIKKSLPMQMERKGEQLFRRVVPKIP
ncbi:hypothetical protein MAMC_00668 [Methylacidimicrobium cyclopophantes]|uniref:AsmA-like C-terminal domain-containing protein n=1 Tax=Methylacidimicrobium cyclopophantes TaxID=1041766 RepID=A0A5E6M9D5_9BACT|nr:hypothetical protein [Methylacidimicrobium cyclopophantes]VVM05558.1 hypothetical protein MAMC_00668 [Methylacidimicrobium cyclopophantes]